MNYIIDKLGIVYLSQNNQQELIYNYSFLIQEKNKLYEKLEQALNQEEPITLETWEIDLLLLNTSQPTEEYIKYYDLQELRLFEILKIISTNPEQLTDEDIKVLYSFFRNYLIIETMIKNGGNGLRLGKRELQILLNILSRRKVTVGTNIKTYTSLCNKLSLNKTKPYTLEKKIAA